MTDDPIQPVSRAVPDLAAEQIAKLKAVFPECVAEGRVDFDRLRATLGDLDALAPRDGYSFTWAGKQEAFRALQAPTYMTLRPAPEESINWDDTRHLFIEGENLEVLKLLYKAYYNRVKMIYIDPPYNTGNDFIYQDDFAQPRRAYLEKTGQMDAQGNRLVSNPESSGRYHSDWLSMIYPRLFLARQLLRDDGVIFVSIDDHEVHHLRLVMNEVFGEENFVAQIVVIANRGGQDYLPIAKTHEYILCYVKRSSDAIRELPRDTKAYRYVDARGRYQTRELRNRNPKFHRGNRPNLFYPIYANPTLSDKYGQCAIRLTPAPGYEIAVYPRNSEGNDSCWRWGKQRVADSIVQGDVEGSQVVARITPSGKWNIYEKNRKSTTKAKSIWDEKVMRTESGTIGVRQLFGDAVMDHPKPVALVAKALLLGAGSDDIILDFFAGSCTTAQAVLELNREDGGHRQFIMVQMPEPTDRGDYATIADIGQERIRRVIARMREERDGQLPLDGAADEDLGFKVFKLGPFTQKQWVPPAADDVDALAQQLAAFDDGLQPDASETDILYEVLIKEGYSPHASIQPLDVGGQRVYRIQEPDDADGRAFYACLEPRLAEATVDALPLERETLFVCRDTALDDSLKTNLSLRCVLRAL